MMTPPDVLRVLDVLASERIDVWIDGGWGVDALSERQTRDHEDLDLVVDHHSLDRVARSLTTIGLSFDPTARPGLPGRLALRDTDGHRVDVHPAWFDARGNGWQPLGEGAWGLYDAAGLRGHGTIGDRRVRCTTAELQLRHHLGYPWTDVDRHDLSLLSERFDIPLPPV